MAAFVTALLAVLALSMVATHVSGAKEQRTFQQELRTTLSAEAGLGESFVALQHGRNGNLGTADLPVELAGGQVFVTAQTFGPAGKFVRVTSVAHVGTSEASAELILRDNVDSMFVWSAFGDRKLDLASQAKVDSYDSTLGTYASQVAHGSGSNAWARDNGNIGSNGNVSIKQNGKVFGDAVPGENSALTVIGNATVSGATANATEPFDFPPVEVPTIASSGNKTFNSNTTLPSGSYHYAATVTDTNITLTVKGPATLVFDSFEMRSRSNLRVDSTLGPVDIYVMNDFVMRSNTLLASNNLDPRAVRLKLLSDNVVNPEIIVDLDDVLFESNAQLYGTLYAPDAAIKIDSNFEVFGSVIAEEVSLASNSRVHYDEALGRVLNPGAERYARVSWRTLH
jgi:hypothetical protein